MMWRNVSTTAVRLASVWLLAGLLAAFGANIAHADTRVTLKPAARIPAGAHVTLDDVATIKGDSASTIGAIIMCDAAGNPLAQDGWIAVSTDDVRSAINAAGVPMTTVSISGSTCAVRFLPSGTAPLAAPARLARADITTNPYTVRNAITERIAHELSISTDDLDMTFRDGGAGDLLDMPAANRRVDIALASSAAAARISIRTTIYEGDRMVRTATVIADVKVRQLVVTPVSEIDRGSILTENDITVVEQWVTPGQRPLATREQAIGSKARSRLSPSKPITVADVEPPVVVTRGDVVYIDYLAGSFTLRVRARALSSGRENDIIELRIEGATRTIQARITAPGRAVMVDASAKESCP
jgi:flagella basal body P-ring formation protein FlgA